MKHHPIATPIHPVDQGQQKPSYELAEALKPASGLLLGLMLSGVLWLLLLVFWFAL